VAPTTSAAANPPADASGINHTNVTVNLAAIDNAGGSGVKQIKFTAIGAQSTIGIVHGSDASILISAEGATRISFSATDNAGNTEAPKTLSIKIDKTLP
jgi:hypothetical protein